MVSFAPDVQQTPGYLYGEESARAISPIAPDTSKEIALKGAGQALGQGLKVAEDYTHQSILTAEHQGLDTINDQAIERLTAAKANPSLIDQETEPPPEALKRLPAGLDRLDQARANNKISQTYIDMQKDQLAKSLRSSYPGFRDYIDETFAKSSREDPANKYISSLVGDINSLAAAGRAAKDKTDTLIMQGLERGYDDWDKVSYAYRHGKLTPDQVRGKFFEQAHRDALEKREDHQILHENRVRENQQHLAENVVTERANAASINYFDTHMFASGKTASQILAETSKGPMDAATAQQFATEVETGKNQWLIDFQNELSRPADGDPSKPSYATVLGPEKTKAIIAEGAARWDNLGKMFTDERAGIATASLRLNKAISDDTRLKMLDPKTQFGRTNLILTELSKSMAPSAFEKLLSEIVIPGDYDQTLGAYIKTGKLDMMMPQDKDHPTTATAQINQVSQLGDKVTARDKSGAVKDLLGNVDKLEDPGTSPEVKGNIINSYFGPGNEKLLSGVARPSQMEVWKHLTSDKVAKEAYKVGGPSYAKYSDWVKSTFGTQLFPNDIRDLNEITTTPDFKIGWDNVNHQVVLKNTKMPDLPKRTGTPADFGRGAVYAQYSAEYIKAQAATDRINAGIKSVSHLSHYEQLDTNAYILKLLAESNLKGLSKELNKAIINSHGVE